MVKRGKLIVVEGPDAVGKGTQTRLLFDHLKAEGIPVTVADFPQYYNGFFGKFVGRFLSGEFGDLEKIPPHFAALPFAADRWEASHVIENALSSDRWVVSNRYTLSNKAHQGAKLPPEKRQELFRFIDQMEYEIFGIPRENLNIWLDVEPEVAAGLARQKSEREYLSGLQLDIAEINRPHQDQTYEIYQLLSELHPNVTRIKCTERGNLLPKERVHEMVWECISKRFDYELSEGRIKRERES